MEHPIPRLVIRRFDSDHARPVIAAEYQLNTGWAKPKRRTVLDVYSVEEMHHRGVTLVRAKWHLRTHEFSIFRLREEREHLESH